MSFVHLVPVFVITSRLNNPTAYCTGSTRYRGSGCWKINLLSCIMGNVGSYLIEPVQVPRGVTPALPFKKLKAPGSRVTGSPGQSISSCRSSSQVESSSSSSEAEARFQRYRPPGSFCVCTFIFLQISEDPDEAAEDRLEPRDPGPLQTLVVRASGS